VLRGAGPYAHLRNGSAERLPSLEVWAICAVKMKTTIKYIVLGVALLTSSIARANPRPLPFSYPVETLAAGDVELEVYGDVTPLRVYRNPSGDPSQGRLWEPGYALQNEFEYGLTDRVELAFYQSFVATPQDGGGNTMTFDGLKWEARTRLADAGAWPIDVGLYLELETMHDELSLEGKVLLGKHWGRLHALVNLWVEASEHDAYNDSRTFHFILNPTAGLAYQVTPTFHPGFEYWARGELGTVGQNGTDIINNRIHHFIGPTAHLNFGKFWWTAGLYADLNNATKPQPGEIYGAWWGRSVLGLNL
jgi:hypothetical protein